MAKEMINGKLMELVVPYVKNTDGVWVPNSGITFNAGTEEEITAIPTFPLDVEGNVKGDTAIQDDYSEQNPMGDSIKTIAKTSSVVLQNAAGSTGNGSVFLVKGYKEILISITGTGTVVFEGSDVDGNYSAIVGVKEGDTTFPMASQIAVINVTGEKWRVPVSGYTNFRTRVSAVSGSITVKGEGVA